MTKAVKAPAQKGQIWTTVRNRPGGSNRYITRTDGKRVYYVFKPGNGQPEFSATYAAFTKYFVRVQ